MLSQASQIKSTGQEFKTSQWIHCEVFSFGVGDGLISGIRSSKLSLL